MTSTNSATSSWPLSVDIDVVRKMSMPKRRQIFMDLSVEQRTIVVNELVQRERECLYPPGILAIYVDEVVIVLAAEKQVEGLSIAGKDFITNTLKEKRLIWSSKLQNMKWVDVDWLGVL